MGEPRPIALVAMGGHAFMQADQVGTIEEHERNAEHIAGILMTLVERGYNLIVTHGNGPQVGSLLIQQEQAREGLALMPLDVLVAMTEGSLGYILQQALLNQLRRREMKTYVVTVVTQVVVDAQDPAFQSYNKPIGPYFSRDEAERRRTERGWQIGEDPGGHGYRRLVPSPRPLRVIQRHMIRETAQAGHIVVACGGGGIPIHVREDGKYVGIEAVVDKDLTSSVLARDVLAEILIILTAVPHVYVDFGKPGERALTAVTLDEIRGYFAAGQFPAGSMGPKIEAAIGFLDQGGRRALITDPDSLPAAMEGRAGTHIIGRL
jgi:carbamate kinase